MQVVRTTNRVNLIEKVAVGCTSSVGETRDRRISDNSRSVIKIRDRAVGSTSNQIIPIEKVVVGGSIWIDRLPAPITN